MRTAATGGQAARHKRGGCHKHVKDRRMGPDEKTAGRKHRAQRATIAKHDGPNLNFPREETRSETKEIPSAVASGVTNIVVLIR